MSHRTVITIGNFDGVHVGHRAILHKARELADEHGAAVRAMTFFPSPRAVLRPESAPPRLSDIGDRVKLLRGAGADDVVVFEPTRQFLGQGPAEFVEHLCCDLHPVAFVEGPDFQFGQGRAGDVNMLREMGGVRGFSVHVVQPVSVALSDQLLAPVSSSLVRWLLSMGRVNDAALALGRAYALSAEVVKGERLGRTLGVPTANLDPATLEGRMVPADGVYGGLVTVPGEGEYPAAISIGVKPTLQGRSRVVEAHLLGFNGDLYGKMIEARFTRYLRDQQRFPDVQTLTKQLRRDVAAVARLRLCNSLAETLCPAGPPLTTAGDGR